MRSVLGVVLLAFAVSCGGSPARTPEVAPERPPPAPSPTAIKDTPAGATLTAWLDAFNSGDLARLEAFVARYQGPVSAAGWLGFHQQTGGLELVEMESRGRMRVRFVVEEKASPTQAVGSLRVADGGAIATFTLLAVPDGMTAAEMTYDIDAATRTRVVEAAAAKLTELYVYPEVAEKMAQALRDHQGRGAYDAIEDGPELADLLTEQLQAVSHDRHLHVEFVPMKLPEGDPEPTEEEQAQARAQLEQINCGFEKAERLDGNIGYVKFNFFGDAEICGPKATEALGSLGEVDALVFDLRDNGGGQPEMVAFVSSYLFEKRTHLNDLYDRAQDKSTEYWTEPGVPGTKLATQPVYVLTSARTFSGAEEFAYNLKNLKRATIIGETTGGGAHPTMGQRIDDHFMIGVPFARAINPISKTNWEGTGVEPDVKVPAAEALETAQQLAAERIAEEKQAKKAKKRKKKR